MLYQKRYSEAEFRKLFPRVVLNHHAWPKRQSDKHVILLSIAAFFDHGRPDYREVDVNDLIMTWNAHFGGTLNLDHVTLRRALIDARILRRSDDGQCYSIVEDAALTDNVAVIRELDLPSLVADELQRRQRAQQQYRNANALNGGRSSATS
jgi:hypothetical protein